MSLSQTSEVIPCNEDDGSVPHAQYKFCPLAELPENFPEGSLVGTFLNPLPRFFPRILISGFRCSCGASFSWRS